MTGSRFPLAGAAMQHAASPERQDIPCLTRTHQRRSTSTSAVSLSLTHTHTHTRFYLHTCTPSLIWADSEAGQTSNITRLKVSASAFISTPNYLVRVRSVVRSNEDRITLNLTKKKKKKIALQLGNFDRSTLL